LGRGTSANRTFSLASLIWTSCEVQTIEPRTPIRTSSNTECAIRKTGLTSTCSRTPGSTSDGEAKGQPVYGVKVRGSFHGDAPVAIAREELLTDSGVFHEHLKRIKKSIANDPASAISSCKELLESFFKLTLDQEGVEYPAKDDVPDLYKKVGAALQISAESAPGSSKESQTLQMLFRTLVTTVQAVTELRNEIGTGHGRTTTSIATEAHAGLALNSTVTIAEFLLDTLSWRSVDKDLYELI
jgi:hypothetical protein